VCTFPIPANPWPWKALVWGQLQMKGIGISLGASLLDAQVVLGDPTTGTLVAAGWGNNSGGALTIMPQTSSSTSSNTTAGTATAMTPTNSTGLVPANHTGTAGTLYVNVVNNKGMASTLNFTNANAQLFVLVIPAATEGAVAAGIFGSLATQVTLSAVSIVLG
jgi:hypothetical protein